MTVYGIHEDAGRQWVQLSVKGRPGQFMTVSLSAADSVHHAMLQVGTWIAQTTRTAERRVA